MIEARIDSAAVWSAAGSNPAGGTPFPAGQGHFSNNPAIMCHLSGCVPSALNADPPPRPGDRMAAAFRVLSRDGTKFRSD